MHFPKPGSSDGRKTAKTFTCVPISPCGFCLSQVTRSRHVNEEPDVPEPRDHPRSSESTHTTVARGGRLALYLGHTQDRSRQHVYVPHTLQDTQRTAS